MDNQAEPLNGKRILVVEDDFLVAQTVIDILEDAGALVVGPIGWLAEAVALIEQGNDAVDWAVIDVNLHGEKSYPIADALAARGIRFVFATGYDAGALDQAYRSYPQCQKPFNRDRLLQTLFAE